MKPLKALQMLLWLALLCWSPFAVAEKSPFQDVYLTNRRICRSCWMQPISETHVRLINQAGEAEIVLARDVLGVDEHPVQRKILDHFAKHMNPISMHYLLPNGHYGVENDFYGHYGKPLFIWDKE
ncbi:MAG: hypothetical protein ACK551_03520 [Vampirovibrionales bacterium]